MNRIAAMAAAFSLATAALIAGGAPAGADAPAQQGWWVATNPGTVLGSPTPPAPPDVPADGLLIEGGSNTSSPTAYAALVYQVPSQATVGSLTLNVAPGSGTTPATSLQVCPLKTPAINAEQGGPMGDAPAYKTSGCVTQGPSASGTSYTFNVSSFVADDALAVAILPTASTDRVVLSKPAADSLPVRAAPSSSSGGSSSSGFTGTGSSDSGSSGSFGASGGSLDSGSTSGGFGSLPSTGSVTNLSPPAANPPAATAPAQAAAAPAAAPKAGTAAGAAIPLASGAPGPAAAKPWAVGLLLAAAALGLILWMAAGRAARAATRTVTQS